MCTRAVGSGPLLGGWFLPDGGPIVSEVTAGAASESDRRYRQIVLDRRETSYDLDDNFPVA